MAKEEKVNIFGIVLATLIVITLLLLYGYSKVKDQYDKKMNIMGQQIEQHYNEQLVELKLAICQAYGFTDYELYTSLGENSSYDECSIPHCGGISYWPMDSLIKNKYNLSYIKEHLGCGGGGPGGPLILPVDDSDSESNINLSSKEYYFNITGSLAEE